MAMCTLPTPLTHAERLTEYLHGPRVFKKRDDLTGLAVGGNKARACEFILAQARASGHDLLIAVGPQHSNQLCALTAAAKKCGMRVILRLLEGDGGIQGNLLLMGILGAEMRFTGVDLSRVADAHAQMEHLADELRSAGAKPYGVRYGALPVAGIAGYVLLMGEILAQLGETANEIHIFVGSGSGLTQAGLLLGNAMLGGRCRVHGVMLDERFDQEEQQRHVLNAVEAGSVLLGAGRPVEAGEVDCIPGYSGHDVATHEKALEAVGLVARTEGVFLDPIYTGRVMAAMMEQLRAGRISSQDIVVFYHSGGIPAVFSHCPAEFFQPGS